jgi:molecular chaperone HtpG
LQRLFKEDRGHHYFIGEVFALDKDLIPNSQRDYFNENPTRVVFERELRRYFNDELTRIYYDGSAANSAYKKIDAYKEKEADFRNKEDVGAFVDTQHKEKERAGIEKARADAEKAMKSIGKMKKKAEDAPDSVMGRIIQRIESERGSTPPIEIPAPIPAAYPPQREKNPWRTDKLSSLNKKERKLVAKILGIIVATADKETAEKIIRKIEEELQ